ncbi:MAG: hypothetical protein AB8B87_18455 [Granulosicoccus sp.]
MTRNLAAIWPGSKVFPVLMTLICVENASIAGQFNDRYRGADYGKPIAAI